MVLQKLTELYHELKSEGKIDPMGWAQVNIAYQLNLTNDGKVEEIRPYKCRESLPAPVRRTSHPTANFLWDNAMYLLGYPIGQKTKVDPKEYAAQCFEVSKKLHAEKLQDVDSPAAKAIVKFFETWDPENLNVDASTKKDFAKGANLEICVEGEPAAKDPAVRDAWESNAESRDKGLDMVTGEITELEGSNPIVKGVPGTGGTGARLVSFGMESSWSYGLEKNENAPIGKDTAFAYTSALNYLLSQKTYWLGSITIVCWAKNGDSAYADQFGRFVFDANEPDLVELDPDMEFYVLGLDGKKARLAVRMFLHGKFGDMIRCAEDHYKRMDIVRPLYNDFDRVPLWKILQDANDAMPPALLAEMLRAIVEGTPYPALMVHEIYMRVRSDGKVSRERAGMIKAYYLQHGGVPDEDLSAKLNPDSTDLPYTIGRIYSVSENLLQSSGQTLRIAMAMSSPQTMMPQILARVQNTEKSLMNYGKYGIVKVTEKQLRELLGKIEGYPQALSMDEQGAFLLGYYHQTQARYR